VPTQGITFAKLKKFAQYMNLRRLIVLNRLPIGIATIIAGLLITFFVKHGIYYSWLFFIVGILVIVAHFLIGPITLLQKSVESGDMDDAKFLLSKVSKPDWLYKPVRSAYYMMQSQFNTLSDNYEDAEANIKKSLENGSQKEVEGTAYLQLATIALRKGNMKEANEHAKKALQVGLPDKDSEAGAYLMLSNISASKRDFRSTKLYFNKAVACKPKNEQIREQINQFKSVISRMPG
jgi:tetratricopeptide (TPR) repeat protein